MRKIKLIFQKIFRGWSDEDTWSLYSTTARFLAPRLKKFKELNKKSEYGGYPPDITEEEWDDILDKMILAFDQIVDDDELQLYESGEETAARYEKIHEGLDLFKKYYFDLWW